MDTKDKLMACLEVGKTLTSTLDLKKILELIMVKVSQLIKAQNWSLFLKDENSQELTFEIVVGINPELVKGVRLAPGEGIAGYVVQTGNPLFLPRAQGDPRFSPKIDRLTGFTTQSMICLPLKYHGKVLGAIEIINIRDLEAFEQKDFPILNILADYAAIAIENSLYLATIQKKGITDEYTGLWNARYLHQFLEEWMAKEGGRENPLAVVFMDVDDFKRVVDQHGHLLGSQVLKEIGETIASGLSEEDVLVKYGGDEYVILFPGKNRQEAIHLTNQILQRIRASTYLPSDPAPVKVTASFGIALYPEDAITKKDLLLLADNLMYGIKKANKNGIGVISS